MKYVIILLLIWIFVAFIYSKIKKCGLFTAMFKLILLLLGGIFGGEEDKSKYSRMRSEVRKANRPDLVDKINQMQEEDRESRQYVQSVLDSFHQSADEKISSGKK